MITADFYAALFDADDHTCFASVPNGTSVYHHQSPVRERSEYFTINALDPVHDRGAHAEYHHELVPRRADCNVVKYRNFLVEMDGPTIQEQKALVRRSGLPWTTAVWSGGKSIHFITSLEDPLPDAARYEAYWRCIEAALRGVGAEVDAKCKNPSRLSRAANSYRADKGQTQLLLRVRERVPNAEFLRWAASMGARPDMFAREEPLYYGGGNSASDDERWEFAKRCMRGEECVQGNRNNFQYKLAGYCRRVGLSREQTYWYMRRDFSPLDDRDPVASAWRSRPLPPIDVMSREEYVRARTDRAASDIIDRIKNI